MYIFYWITLKNTSKIMPSLTDLQMLIAHACKCLNLHMLLQFIRTCNKNQQHCQAIRMNRLPIKSLKIVKSDSSDDFMILIFDND